MAQSMLDLQNNGKQVTSLNDADLLLATTDPAGVPDDAVIEVGDLKALFAGSGNEGNYIITPSIVANALVVALKTLAGTDATVADKITFRIGDARRDLTAALSLNEGGANTWNLASSELNGRDTQLFVYIGWKTATSEMFLGLARMPYARTYGDLSASGISEKYLKTSLAVGPAATDPVEVIGRIQFRNTSGVYSIPNSNVINRPIYETDYLTYAPQISSATGAITTLGAVTGTYRISLIQVDIYCDIAITNNGTGGGALICTLPCVSTVLSISPGREGNSTGKMLQAYSVAGAPGCNIYNYDNSYPGGNGYRLYMSINNIRLK